MKAPSPMAWRYNLLFGLLVLMLAALGVRLALLVRDGQAHAAAATRRQQRMIIPRRARPGDIYARAGRRYVLLAGSELVPGCFADPALLEDAELPDVAVRVARALQADPAALQAAMLRRRKSSFVWLKRGISSAQAEAVESLPLPSVGVMHEWRRQYPNAQCAASVVGFRYVDHRPGGGLELSCDKYLAAADGVREVLVDAARRPIWQDSARSVPPQDGRSVYLCLDVVVQGYIEQAVAKSVEKFNAQWGVGIVADPHTGEILGMCSIPTFDPNRFGAASSEARTNRAIVAPYEPGSVAKPIFAAAAVDAGLAGYQTKIFCENGTYRASRGGRITDHGKRYGYLSLADVVVFSSNIGMAKVGEKFGNEQLYDVVQRFGFGQKTGINLPGEGRGIVRPLRLWDGYSMRRIPFGQELSSTSIQLVMAFGALANGGLLLRPRLVDVVTDPAGREVWKSSRQVVRRVLKPTTAARTLEVLQEVVARGTGKACRMKRWTSFGKTGTAQIAGVGGYADGAYTGTFIGGAPASRPAVICLISIYWPEQSRGYYGATVAAPYVKEVLERTLLHLDVPSDR